MASSPPTTMAVLKSGPEDPDSGPTMPGALPPATRDDLAKTKSSAAPAKPPKRPDDIFLAFFDNDGFFCETPDGFYHRGAPPGLRRAVEEGVERGKWLATGLDNSYFYRFVSKADGKIYSIWRLCPSPLESDLSSSSSPAIRVSLGGHKADYFLSKADGQLRWVAGTSTVRWLRELKARLGPPTFLALGKGTMAVALFKDEIATKDVPDRLHQALVDADAPVRFIALSPYNSSHYFIQLENGSIAFSLSPSVYSELRVPLASATQLSSHVALKISRTVTNGQRTRTAPGNVENVRPASPPNTKGLPPPKQKPGRLAQPVVVGASEPPSNKAVPAQQPKASGSTVQRAPSVVRPSASQRQSVPPAAKAADTKATGPIRKSASAPPPTVPAPVTDQPAVAVPKITRTAASAEPSDLDEEDDEEYEEAEQEDSESGEDSDDDAKEESDSAQVVPEPSPPESLPTPILRKSNESRRPVLPPTSSADIAAAPVPRVPLVRWVTDLVSFDSPPKGYTTTTQRLAAEAERQEEEKARAAAAAPAVTGGRVVPRRPDEKEKDRQTERERRKSRPVSGIVAWLAG